MRLRLRVRTEEVDISDKYLINCGTDRVAEK